VILQTEKNVRNVRIVRTGAVPGGTRFLFCWLTRGLRPGLMNSVPSGLDSGAAAFCYHRKSADHSKSGITYHRESGINVELRPGSHEW